MLFIRINVLLVNTILLLLHFLMDILNLISVIEIFFYHFNSVLIHFNISIQLILTYTKLRILKLFLKFFAYDIIFKASCELTFSKMFFEIFLVVIINFSLRAQNKHLMSVQFVQLWAKIFKYLIVSNLKFIFHLIDCIYAKFVHLTVGYGHYWKIP